MPLVSVTRLRVRALRFLPAFFVGAARAARQARRAQGNVGVALLSDAHRAFWTATAWSDEDSMRAFMIDGAHGVLLRKLKRWCDEAAVAHWSQESSALPSWEEAHRRLQAEGRRSKVNHPTPQHEAFRIAPPVVRGRRP